MRYFRRFRMEFTFAERELPAPVLPAGYEFVPWDPLDLDRHSVVKYASFDNELDSLIFPSLATLDGCRRLMLEIAAPVLSTLLLTPGRIDVRPAMSFFMIGAVHMALMFMVLKVATTMVAGWSVFGLARNDELDRRASSPAPAAASPRAHAVPRSCTCRPTTSSTGRRGPRTTRPTTRGRSASTAGRSSRGSGSSARASPST